MVIAKKINEINHILFIDHSPHTHTNTDRSFKFSIFNQSSMDHQQQQHQQYYITTETTMDQLPLKKRIIRSVTSSSSKSNDDENDYHRHTEYRHTEYRQSSPPSSPTTSETDSLDSGFSEQCLMNLIEPLDLSYQTSLISSSINSGKFYKHFSDF